MKEGRKELGKKREYCSYLGKEGLDLMIGETIGQGWWLVSSLWVNSRK